HALGLRVLRDAGRAASLDEGKYERLAATLPDAPPPGRAALAELARFARLELSALAGADEVAELAGRYGVELPVPADEARDLVAELPARGAEASEPDYTDLLYLPVRLSLPPPRFAFVCVDEAQDLSRLALAFVERMIAVGARALFVGDPHQAIYAFAGADSRSLPRIARRTGATRLPLSVSFRCPTRHVVLARRFSPAMLPAPGAGAGTVRVSQLARLPDEARPGDLVLSRTNGPLLDLALALAAAGLPVSVLGDELLPGAEELALRLAARGRLDRAAVLAAQDEERRRLEAEHLTSLALPHLLEASRQRHAAVALALSAAGSGDVHAVTAALRRLFPAAEPAAEHVLLATVHKAKGREAERVFLLAPEELGVGADRASAPPDMGVGPPGGGPSLEVRPSREAEDDAAEANVLFVALTRAKRELVLVERAPGAVAARLREHGKRGPPGWLTRRWDDVLRLALLMSESAGGTGISSRHGEARRVQDAGRQARRGRRGGGGRPHRGGRGDGRLLPRAGHGPRGPDRGPRGSPG
ncbi:MAG TPA: UvrD-helicase domain-containing protein, partial [Trueperaceae bacterium]|nr:UvrD-helicase domain-containing protein [Trueperaceae bacterium]